MTVKIEQFGLCLLRTFWHETVPHQRYNRVSGVRHATEEHFDQKQENRRR